MINSQCDYTDKNLIITYSCQKMSRAKWSHYMTCGHCDSLSTRAVITWYSQYPKAGVKAKLSEHFMNTSNGLQFHAL